MRRRVLISTALIATAAIAVVPGTGTAAHGKKATKLPGAANGTFKNYYNRGTTRGTFELTVVASSPTHLTYTGTVTYTGGTGKFKHVQGGGTIACTTTDGGAHKSCVVDSTLTQI